MRDRSTACKNVWDMVHASSCVWSPGKLCAGFTDLQEFEACLRKADVILSPTQIKILVQEVDKNRDGIIDYSEFATMAYSILFRELTKHAAADNAFEPEDELSQHVLDKFAATDNSSSGTLSLDQLKAAMLAMAEDDLPLNELQIQSLIATARLDGDEHGVVYKHFVPVVVKALQSVADSDRMQVKHSPAVVIFTRADCVRLLTDQINWRSSEPYTSLVLVAMLTFSASNADAIPCNPGSRSAAPVCFSRQGDASLGHPVKIQSVCRQSRQIIQMPCCGRAPSHGSPQRAAAVAVH
jgi:Ca2+-binding EF-hand superfamily protein